MAKIETLLEQIIRKKNEKRRFIQKYRSNN